MKESAFFENQAGESASAQDLERLKTITRIIGGDFEMKVEMGKPGSGSVFNPKEAKVILDPNHVKESPEDAEYTVAHEGSHRAISLGPEQMGLKEEKIKEYYSKLGFSSLVNTMEDTAVDSWATGKFEGLKSLYQKRWDRFIEIGVVPGAPEVQGAIGILGRMPKFIRFCHEVYRFWHQGKFSEDLDPGIRQALEGTKDSWQRIYQEIPGPYRDSKEILDKGRKRFSLVSGRVWPEFQKLVEEDLSQEKIKQILEDALKQGKKAVEDLKNQLSGKDSKELEGHIGQTGQKIPVDRFSPGLNNALQKVFNQLPKDTQEKLADKARENLEKFEDAITEAIRGKLSLDNSPSHRELGIVYDKEDRSELAAKRKGMEKFIEKQSSIYDRYYEEVAPLINELYNKLEKIFLPQKYLRWKKDFPSGGRLSLGKAMEFEKDPSKYTKLFERKTMPQKRDYRFSLRVDLSLSMKNDKRIEETFKGVILISEVLNKLGIRFEVYGLRFLR